MEVAQVGGLITSRGGINDAIFPGWARPLALRCPTPLSPPCLCSPAHPPSLQLTPCSPFLSCRPVRRACCPLTPCLASPSLPPQPDPRPQHGPGCHALLLGGRLCHLPTTMPTPLAPRRPGATKPPSQHVWQHRLPATAGGRSRSPRPGAGTCDSTLYTPAWPSLTPSCSLTLGTPFTHWAAPTGSSELCGHIPLCGEGQCEATKWATCSWRLESELGPGWGLSSQTHPRPWAWLQSEVAARGIHIRPTPSQRRLSSSWQPGPYIWATSPTSGWGRWPLLFSPQWAGGTL